MKYKSEIKNQNFEEERSLYNAKEVLVDSCKFSGPADGESPLKEARDIKVKNCSFDLRYAFWHVINAEVEDTKFSNTARAPFWYSKNIALNNIESESVKIFRECQNIDISSSSFVSEEPFWRCSDLTIKNSKLSGFYGFFESNNVNIDNIDFFGKYSFQYNKHLRIKNSRFDTKDAFWHCEDAIVENSVIKGEYIGWYSKNMTFINCTIESHQPFCYAENLKFIDCKMPNCDLAFENSTVRGNIIGEIESIKNPRDCILTVGRVNKLIKEKYVYPIKVNISKSN